MKVVPSDILGSESISAQNLPIRRVPLLGEPSAPSVSRPGNSNKEPSHYLDCQRFIIEAFAELLFGGEETSNSSGQRQRNQACGSSTSTSVFNHLTTICSEKISLAKRLRLPTVHQ